MKSKVSKINAEVNLLDFDYTGNICLLEQSICGIRNKFGSNSRSDIKAKYDKIFLQWLSLSRFLAKTQRVNKIAMKSLKKEKKNSWLESTLNCRFRHSCIKLTHTTWVVWEDRPLSSLKLCNGQLCMYVCMYATKLADVITITEILNGMRITCLVSIQPSFSHHPLLCLNFIWFPGPTVGL